MRKLLPGLYNRDNDGQLPPESRIFGAARADLTREAYVASVEAPLVSIESTLDPKVLERFLAQIDYVQIDATGGPGWRRLAKKLGATLDRVRVCYLATSPDLFGPICHNLAAAQLVTPADPRRAREAARPRPRLGASHQRRGRPGLRRGADLPHRSLPRQGDGAEPDGAALRQRPVRAALELQRISTMSRSPSPRPSASASAAGYYDKSGALRDMVQNHMLQLLCLVAMEPPSTFDADARARREAEGAARAASRSAARDVAPHDGPRPVPRRRRRRRSRCRAISTSSATTPAPPRPSSRQGGDRRTGAGPACRSTCAPASGCRARASEIVIQFARRAAIRSSARRAGASTQPAGHAPAARRGHAALLMSKDPGPGGMRLQQAARPELRREPSGRPSATPTNACSWTSCAATRHCSCAGRGRGGLALDRSDPRGWASEAVAPRPIRRAAGGRRLHGTDRPRRARLARGLRLIAVEMKA